MSLSGRAMCGIAFVLALALSACGDDSGGSDEAAPVLCEIGEEIEALIDPTTPEEAEEYWSEFQDLMAEAAAVAPDEVSDDVDLGAEVVAGLTVDDFAAALESGSDPLDTPELNEASERLDNWEDENC